tara:strand:+ start:491 stop:826 length:336 start_codon:yes stop_codon:yes gene_type:complete
MMNEYLIRFFMGGLVVSLSSYFASTKNSKLASLIWSIPISLFIILYYMHQSGKSNQDISKFLEITSHTVILTVLYLFILSKTIKNTNNFSFSIVFVSILWLIGAYVFYQIN